jgi:putative hemolysin
MVPRVDIVAAPRSEGVPKVLELMLRHGISRIPVYDAGIDDIDGVAYAKDLLAYLSAGNAAGTMPPLRKPLFVPETNRAAELLKLMRARQVHIAIVTDEYGSTAGLVTLEDLLEELVGDISDEYDRVQSEVEKVGDGQFRISGRLSIDRLNELAGAQMPDDGWDTVAGLVLALLGAVPEPGATVRQDGVVLTVERMSGRRIAEVLVTVDRDPG